MERATHGGMLTYTQDQLSAPRMADDEIASHLEALKDRRPRVAARAGEALDAELKRLRAACDMALRGGVGDFGECLAGLRAYVAAVGNPRWIKSVERREGRRVAS